MRNWMMSKVINSKIELSAHSWLQIEQTPTAMSNRKQRFIHLPEDTVEARHKVRADQ